MAELPNRYVITGLPGAGKTTWVSQNSQPGDLVWDYDAVAETLFGMAQYAKPAYVTALMESLIFPVLSAVRSWSNESHKTFIIITDPTHARKAAAMINAKLITIVNEVERIQRINMRNI